MTSKNEFIERMYKPFDKHTMLHENVYQEIDDENLEIVNISLLGGFLF